MGLFGKKPKIQFVTDIEGLPEVEPVVPAVKAIPEWFRTMVHKRDSTMDKGVIKHCPAIPDYFRVGYTVRAWCDMRINVMERGHAEWNTPDSRFEIEWHPMRQFPDHLPEPHRSNALFLAKPKCPWHLITSKGYSVLQLPPMYSYNDGWEVMPGVIHTDTHHFIHQQILITGEPREILIERGTPLATYVPFKREEYDFSCEMETEKTRYRVKKSQLNISSKFKGGYRDAIRREK